ncbi:MAG: hypothetical protein WD607_09940, partial [Candidatus Paceibacterota bacterium]
MTKTEKFIIIAKEQHAGFLNESQITAVVYNALKREDANNMKDYDFDQVVKVELSSNNIFPPNGLQNYCKYGFPVWIDPVDDVDGAWSIIQNMANRELENLKLLKNTNMQTPNNEQQKFLQLHLFDNKKYEEIEKELNVDLPTIRKWWDETESDRKIINRAKQLFNNKKGNVDFEFPTKDNGYAFYIWFSEQKRVCYYCGTEETVLAELFNEKVLSSKRFRGRSLELERLDSKGNKYNEKNCVLACYFCNNHKSDIISDGDFMTYFS